MGVSPVLLFASREFDPFPLQPAAHPDPNPTKDCEATCHAGQNERNKIELKIEAWLNVCTAGRQSVISDSSGLAASGLYLGFHLCTIARKRVTSPLDY